MSLTTSLQSYNSALLQSIKRNKISLFVLTSVSIMGYFALPYVEKYQKTLQKENDVGSEESEKKEK